MEFEPMGSEQVRHTWTERIDLAQWGRQFTAITRRRKPVAVLVSNEWAVLPDRMAAMLMPMAECSKHPVLAGEDPADCRSCAIRRVCLDYIAAGGHADRDIPQSADASWLRLPQRNPGQET